ncbi:uncharacterized protein LOC127639401 [Xyrauchen texanus]|uniref:uncharacterized protein LOC127639401 n=1 Tax=Xyrauchen texanus TaxID=154827 RepID=UPI002242A9D3|nr:uncharacterized protein LOC127639401 [Xyrauchen texanus]
MNGLYTFLTVSVLLVHGVFGDEMVSVMEGDPVTLQTGVVKTQDNKMVWSFNNIRIAKINGGPGKACTDVQCNDGTEGFRGRLKLDLQTGSLTITNMKITDSGLYIVEIITVSSSSEKIFKVTVLGVPGEETDGVEMKSVEEGHSITLDSGVQKIQNGSMAWYFNDTRIAEISGDPSKPCADVMCNIDGRFRGRLQLDQTGSLTITNTRTTDTGQYQLKPSSRRRRRHSISEHDSKTFHVNVINACTSSGVVAGISVCVLLMFAAAVAVVIYYRHRKSKTGTIPPEQPGVKCLTQGHNGGDCGDQTSNLLITSYVV